MENVHGRFDFDNGKVVMNDVNFLFHDAPVQFASGDVMVEDSGRFALAVSELWVKEIRLDPRLRTIMPPLMTACGRTQKKAGCHSTRSASLPTSIDPISWSRPCATAGQMVYFAT